jgi:hypothetical protein
MMRNSAHVAALLSICWFSQISFAGEVPCSTKNAPTGWHTFVDRTHKFCFQYPPVYKAVRDTSERKSIVVLNAEGQIYVWLDKRFSLQQLEDISRSGNPPETTKINGLLFYYVGPGGGGVDYSDDFLFNLRGKILHIEFDGPYINDNHPSDVAKELEPQLLATFRTF